MAGFGTRTIGNKSGERTNISADGFPEYKTGGVTIDWDTVAAVSGSAVTLDDGTIIDVGDKYLRYGTPVDPIAVNAEVQTADLSPGADPDAGTWTVTYNGETTSALAYNASAAAVQAAMDALPNVSVGDVTVTKSGFVYTFTWAGQLGNVAAITTTSSLTASAVATTITVATGTAGSASGGKYGPVDTSVSDGRQTMARGETFVLCQTVIKSDPMSDHCPGGVIEGGKVFRNRLNVGGTNQATLANLLTALPRLQLVND